MSQTSMPTASDMVDAGAIIVPSQFSERFCTHLGRVDGWMIRWNVTEFEPVVGSKAAMFTGILHAIHLLPRGVRLLSALSADMPRTAEYNLVEILLRTDDLQNCPESIAQSGDSSVDGKLLHNLRRACTDINQSLNSVCAFWMPGLRSTSAACHRNWEASLYEAWHTCKNAAPTPRFTFVELFAGIGGFRIGLESLGGRSVLACELNPHVRATYQRNFVEANRRAQPLIDVKRIEPTKIPAYDILTAGFPCQPFTEFNPRRKGLDCENGQLINEVVRILRETRPAAALLENVPGLLTVHGGTDFKNILAALRQAGYVVGWQLVSAEHFVPQRRLRVYIVCIRRDIYMSEQGKQNKEFGSAALRDGDSGGEAVISWLEIEPGRQFGEAAKPLLRHILQDDVAPDAYTLTEDQWAKVVAFEGSSDLAAKRIVNVDSHAKTLRSSYRQDFKTLSQFVPQAGSRPRFFTPRECARLMGFPDCFQPGVGAIGFPRSCNPSTGEGNFYHQLGNSVVPAVIEAIGARILDALGVQ